MFLSGSQTVFEKPPMRTVTQLSGDQFAPAIRLQKTAKSSNHDNLSTGFFWSMDSLKRRSFFKQFILIHIVVSIHANEVSANRTDISALPRLSLGRAVTSHNEKANNLRVIRSYHFLISQSRNGAYALCSGIFVFKNPWSIAK